MHEAEIQAQKGIFKTTDMGFNGIGGKVLGFLVPFRKTVVQDRKVYRWRAL
jgi:hypothetical protein